MTVYHGVISNNSVDNIVHCDRLDEFFKEFIEYRKGKAKTNDFNKNIFPFHNKGKKYSEDGSCGKIFYLDLDFDNAIDREDKKPVVYGEKLSSEVSCFDYSTGGDLGINTSVLKIRKGCLSISKGNQQKGKIEKVLKDIGITGEMKDTYGLDLNGPANQQSQERQEVDDNPIKSPRPKQSEQNLAKGDKEVQELKEKNTQLEKEKKIYGIISVLIFLALVGLIIGLAFRKKVKK